MLRENFGTDGRGNDVELFTLTNANGTQLKISTLGATIVSFIFRDRHGVLRDVVLGYDEPVSYLTHHTIYFGATVGRCANRIANARCTIDGVEYNLEANNGDNNLHSGSNGVSHRIWDVDRVDEEGNCVVLKFFSADLEQGFPGNMTVKVAFTLTDEDAVQIAYEAVTDKDTIANFTNHSYFNLAGHDGGYIGEQKLKIYADAFTAMAPTGSIPTGEIVPVEGTPFDFREFKAFDQDMEADCDQLRYTGGYDHNFVLDNGGELGLAAEAVCEETGIHLYAYTDCPGIQLYVGNYIDEHKGKGGAAYGKRYAFCLESQYFPNAINIPAFTSPLLKVGDVYRTTTVYKLGLN